MMLLLPIYLDEQQLKKTQVLPTQVNHTLVEKINQLKKC